MNELNLDKDLLATPVVYAAGRLKQPDAVSTADYFIIKDGVEYSGTHLLIDLWGASRLDELEYIEDILKQCVQACDASLLHIHLHQFTDSGGVSGVAVLAESHISVHTWPERHYAAFDVFMCGVAKPLNCIDILEQAFTPDELKVKQILRGHKDAK
jgi:S-adenosylmethionine decarboxylase